MEERFEWTAVMREQVLTEHMDREHSLKCDSRGAFYFE
jgi:hypothetical protein